MKVLLLILAAFIVGISTVRAQHHHHHHERNEIGISPGVIYAQDHKEWGMGIHAHYFRTLGDHSRWAVGAFAEQVWLDDTHFSVGAGVRYELVERLHVGAFPGVTFAKHEHDHDGHEHDKSKARFSVHGELVYDLFTWKKFHLGPVLDYSWAKDDSHFMLGIHVAFCF